MKIRLLILSLIIGVVSNAQIPTGYVPFNSMANYISIKADSGLHVPRYAGTPTLRSKAWNGAGLVAVDTVNNKFYFYSGGAWREAGSTNYADSLRRVGLNVQMRKNGNWTSQFDLPDSIPPTPTLQQVLTAGSTIETPHTIEVANQSMEFVNASDFTIEADNGVNKSSIVVRPDSTNLNLKNGNLFILPLNNTLSTTGKKILLRDTVTGLVQNIDPALLPIPDTLNVKYDTCTLATFSAGAGLSTDTAAFQTTTIYGSFYNDGNDTLIITKQMSVLQGSSPSITPTVYWNDSLNVTAGAVKLINSPSALTNTATGTAVTSFDNYKIPPGVWVWVATPTVGTKPTYFSLSLIGYKKRI